MPRLKRDKDSRNSSRNSGWTEDDAAATYAPGQKLKRTATVYDAVTGRIGLNGFLEQDQLASANLLPSRPEEVLLRRVGAPDEVPYDFYNADEKLKPDQRLPDSELLKAIHAYTSDYFDAIGIGEAYQNYRTFDETALLALGILLEEASEDSLGENGDMALVEPEGLENVLPETRMTTHQIVGTIKQRKERPKPLRYEDSESSDTISNPKKRRKATH